MSEHESISGGTECVSPAVMVGSASSKNSTMPHRPTELHDEGAPDLHQKRAPAVTSITEKFKESMETSENKDSKESENAMSTERQKYAAKKLSSNVCNKRRSSSPAIIPMTTLEAESKQPEIQSLSVTNQPIPPISALPRPDRKKDELETNSDDSITSEVAEMRTPEVAKETPEWDINTDIGIALEQAGLKSCSRRGMPLTRPSGITISLPKKSLNNIYCKDNCRSQSGISITVSKRCLDNTTKSKEFDITTAQTTKEIKVENNLEAKITRESFSSYCAHLRGQFDDFYGRIKDALHI